MLHSKAIMNSCRHGQSKLGTKVHSGKLWCSESTRTQKRSGPWALFYNYLSNEESGWGKWASPTNVLPFALKLQSREELLTDREWKPLISEHLESGDLFPIFMHAHNFFLYRRLLHFFLWGACVLWDTYGSYGTTCRNWFLSSTVTWNLRTELMVLNLPTEIPGHPKVSLWNLILECVNVGMVCTWPGERL